MAKSLEPQGTWRRTFLGQTTHLVDDVYGQVYIVAACGLHETITGTVRDDSESKRCPTCKEIWELAQ